MASLCREHLAEQQEGDRRQSRALDVLHYRQSDTPVRESGTFAEDWRLLRDRWRLVCDVRNSERGRRNMPLDEAEYAIAWCITLALELLDAEDAVARGGAPSFSLERTRGWVFERFHHLDAGLTSTGLPHRARP